MSLAAFQRCLAFTWRPENDGQPLHVTAGDPGGATNMGVTLATWRAWNEDDTLTAEDLAAASRSDLSALYASEFWNKVRGDELPDGLDLMVFDLAVMSSPARAARILQDALGIKQDGYVGDVTVQYAWAASVRPLIGLYGARTAAYWRGLPTWARFGKGWTDRNDRKLLAARAMIHPA